MNQTYVIHAFYRCQAREGSNLRNLLSPLWGHGWDKKKVGARGLEPPNLTDVNRAL
jgi:hypothetical protein